MAFNISLSSSGWSTMSPPPETSPGSVFGRKSKQQFKSVALELAIPVTVADGIAIIIGGAASLLVILMIARNRRTLQNIDLLILNLCVSDLLCSIVSQPLLLVRLFAKSKEPPVLILVRRTTMYTFLAAGCLSLFLVTFDKYLSLRFPFRYLLSVNKSRVYASIGGVWLVSCAIGVSPTIDIHVSSIIYLACTSTVFGLTVILQIQAFLIAKAQEDRTLRIQRSISHNYQSERRAERTTPSYVKPTKTIMILFFFYVGTWFPVTLLRFLVSLGKVPKTFMRSWFHALNTLLQLHACVNPFIYVLRTRRVREKFPGIRRILRRSLRNIPSEMAVSVK